MVHRSSGPSAFVADAMLGRLARWLRTLDFDVLFDESLHDDQLVALARRDDRLLLTRDRRLCLDRGSPPWCVLLDAERPAAQLRELHARFRIFRPGWRRRLLSRCTVCNSPLRPAREDEIEELVPDAVRGDATVLEAGVNRCPGCGRAYWRGGHVRRMEEWLERVADVQDVSADGKE